MFVRGIAFAIIASIALIGRSGMVTAAQVKHWVIDLPPGAYMAQSKGYFVSALGGCRQGETVWFGDERVELCFGSAQEPPFPRKNRQWLFYVVRNDDKSHEYQWQAWHGDFRLVNGEIELCGREGTIGVVPSSKSGDNQHTVNFFGDMVGAGRMDKFVMVWDHSLSKDEPPPLPEKDLIHCGADVQGGIPAAPAAGTPWGALTASVAPVMSAPRGVNGMLMLALRGGAAAADKQLWNCLVNDGNYPGVHFVEHSSGEDRWSYIWPDGRFRAVLDGGGLYEWRLAPPIRCGITRAQAYRAEFRVPAAAGSAQEELVLACIVAEEGFSGCQSWWLRRPQ